MKYNFDNVPSRENSACYKYDYRNEVFGRADVIPMWIADMDFEVAPCISDAIKRRTEHALYGYEFRTDAYYNSIINWIARRSKWEVKREWVDFIPGVVPGLVFAVRALTKPGDGVIIQPPVYPPFAGTITSNGRVVVNNPLRKTDAGFEVDFDDLDKKLESAKVLMLCTPHNPTGTVFSDEDLRRMGELCVKHDAYIVADAIHADLLAPPRRHTYIASISPEIADRTITLIAPSKSFNLAGLSTSSYIIPNDGLRERFAKEVDDTHIRGGNNFGNIASIAAYECGEEWLDEANAYIAANMEYVKSFIAENLPSVKAYNGGGTYLMWLDFTEWGMTHEELIKFLIFDAGLGLSDGLPFGEEGRNHARINLSTSRKIVEKALDQLAEAAKKRNL